MADHTFDDRLAERKRKRAEEKAFQEAIKQKANNPSSGLDIDLGGSTVSTTVTQTQKWSYHYCIHWIRCIIFNC